jgi:hypothetical protein
MSKSKKPDAQVASTTPSPEEAWQLLTRSTTPVAAQHVASVFSALKPVNADFLTRGNGEWLGGDVDTGHPAGQQLAALRWAGKTFHSPEHVEPVMVYDDAGRRTWKSDWGHARVSLSLCFCLFVCLSAQG